MPGSWRFSCSQVRGECQGQVRVIGMLSVGASVRVSVRVSVMVRVGVRVRVRVRVRVGVMVGPTPLRSKTTLNLKPERLT